MIIIHQDNVSAFAGAHTYWWLPQQIFLSRIGMGVAVAEGVGASSGSATVSGVGESTAASTASSAGVASVSGVGAGVTVVEAVASVLGVATVLGVSPAARRATGGWITEPERDFLRRLGQPAQVLPPTLEEVLEVLEVAREEEPAVPTLQELGEIPLQAVEAYLETLEGAGAELEQELVAAQEALARMKADEAASMVALLLVLVELA